ncbi:NADP-dependent oxidoreductase domain-containing protein 1-like [Branchiostoma floridae x Branchiostoma japonicum]
MAAQESIFAGLIPTVADITNNLPSLQFESALTDGEKPLLVLRARSHALTVCACAQAAYLVAILNEARQLVVELQTPVSRHSRSSRLLHQAPPRNPVRVGIIGGGRLGGQLAQALLTYGDVEPHEMVVSTRRPEILVKLEEQGVTCLYDNRRVAASCDVLFLCCLPSQLNVVAEDIKGRIAAHCTVYSFVIGVPLPRFKQIFRFSNVLKPELSWRDDGQASWDVSKDVCSCLEDSRVAGLTCPLPPQPDECLIRTGEKWAELAVYIFLNMCSDLQLSWEQSLDLANTVILGQTSTHPAAAAFSTENFTKNIANPAAPFPRFDLSLVTENDTPLTRCLKENQGVRNLFCKKYVSIFDKFYYWKGIKQVKQKKQ